MRPDRVLFNNISYNLKHKPKVSVIVPVYEVGDYVERCVKSVLAQTYENFELVLIDDGSSDYSGQVCDRFADADERIVVIHTANSGQGNARNIGLEVASGDYIVFVDSDDYVHKDYLSIMFFLKEKTNAGIVQTRLKITDSTDLDTTYNINELSYFELNGTQAPNTLKYKVSPCGKLYEKRIFDDIRFGRWTVNEDDAVYYRIAYNSQKICICDECLYFYYQSPSSVMRNNKKDKPTDYIDIYYERIKFFEKEKQEVLIDGTRDRFCLILLLNYFEYIKNKTNISDLDKMLVIFKEQYALISKSKNISAVKKIIYGAFNLAPKLITKLVLFLHIR